MVVPLSFSDASYRAPVTPTKSSNYGEPVFSFYACFSETEQGRSVAGALTNIALEQRLALWHGGVVTTGEELFLMANQNPRLTGLPFVVWISPRANAQHDVCVEVSSGPRAMPCDMVSVGIRPQVHVIEGAMQAGDLALLAR